MYTCGSLVCLHVRRKTPAPLPEGLEEALRRCDIPIVLVDLVDDPAAPRDVALQIVERPQAPLSGVARDLISLYDAVAHRKALLVGEPSPKLIEALAPRSSGLLAPLDCCELHHQALEQPPSWRAMLDSTEPAPQRANYLSTLFSEAPRQVSARVLFWVNGSIPSWRAVLTLYEKALPFEAQRLRVMADPKETKSDAYLAINPRGKTPTLLEPSGVTVDESLAILLVERAVIDPLTAIDPNEQALHHCARSGAASVASLLLERGAELEAQNLTGQTPLMLAAANRYGGRMVALLLERGANAKFLNYAHVGPLHLAALSGSARSVRLLLEAGADPNASSYEAGLQGGPLHYAMAREDAEVASIVSALLKAGADAQASNRERLAPVHLGADSRKSAALRPLLERIAPLGIVDQLDKEKNTALLRAARIFSVWPARAALRRAVFFSLSS